VLAGVLLLLLFLLMLLLLLLSRYLAVSTCLKRTTPPVTHPSTAFYMYYPSSSYQLDCDLG
jgi:hypothetical protein